MTDRMLELTHRPALKLDCVDLWWAIEKNHTVDTFRVINPQRSHEKLPVSIRFKLTNTGTESAQNIVVSYGADFINSSDEHVDLTPYKNKFTSATRDNTLRHKLFDLDLPVGHGETYEIYDDLEVMPSTKCIITFEISYNFLGDSEGYMRYIYEYSQNGRRTLFRRHSS